MEKFLRNCLLIILFIAMNSAIHSQDDQTGKNRENGKYISEIGYDQNMTAVENNLDKIRESGYFSGKNNVQIYYEKYLTPGSKASIVISHGFSENLTKYSEIIYYFINEGYSVFGIEHRGHGRSGLLGKDETQTSVEDFDFYVEDLKTFMDAIVLPQSSKNFIYAHSMGGAVAALFLERYPDYFRAAVLNAPMLDINTGKLPKGFAGFLANINQLPFLKYNYVPGHKPFSTHPDFENANTTSKIRYDYHFNKTMLNKKLWRGGASYLWFKEALKTTSEVVKPVNTAKITTPILLFQAENDKLVPPAGQNKFAASSKNCRIVLIKDAKHEIYREKDSILFPYLDEIFDFFKNYVTNK